MAKKVVVKAEPKEETSSIPKDVMGRLKIIKSKYYKEDTLKDVVSLYKEEYDDIKEKYKDKEWNNRIIHKRALAAFGNKKKKERIGGAVDNYYGVILGTSQVRDLAQKAIGKILDLWKEDPQKTIDDGYVMTKTSVNPTTGEEEKVVVIDKQGNIVPRDNREYFTRKTGGKFRNPNFNHPYAHSYRKTALAIVSNKQGIKGVSLVELRDKAVELDIPTNVLVKFSARTAGSSDKEFKINQTITKETLESVLFNLELELETERIDEKYYNMMKDYYEGLMNEEKEVVLFKLTSSRGTSFVPCNSKIDFEKAGFPLKEDNIIDVNTLYKEYLYPFTAECAKLVEFHNIHQFLDEDQQEKNYDEFVVLQDVDVLQINMEESLSGNYKVYVSDESLNMNEIIHNEDLVDSILVLIPSDNHIDFGQDSKINVVGSIFQFQSQDENREPIYEEEETEDGETVQIPILDYPMIKAYGVYPIPQFKVDVDTIDLAHDDEITDEELSEELDTEELLGEEEEEEEEEKPKSKPKAKPKAKTPAKKKPVKKEEESEESEEPEEEEPDIW